MSKRLLLIAYRFPPVIGSGTFRPLKFAKYLPRLDWQPTILCAKPTSYDKIDEALLGELPTDVLIERVSPIHPKQIENGLLILWKVFWKLRLHFIAKHLEPYKLLNWMPLDPYITWIIPAYQSALRLIKHYQPSVVLTSSPPHSIQLVGLWLKMTTGIPWVADMRDLWSQNTYYAFPTSFHRKANIYCEDLIYKNADCVITVTQTMTKMLRERHSYINSEKFHTITNGFDPDDFYSEGIDRRVKSQLRIVHTGELYGLRTPSLLLACVDKLVNDGRLNAAQLSLEFIGLDGTGVLEKYSNRSWVHRLSPLPHRKAIEAMMTSDVCLLLENSEDTHGLPSKLFEYIATSRPILAIVPSKSEIARILETTNSGIIAEFDNADAISRAILQIYHKWQRGELAGSSDAALLNAFDVRNLTFNLAELLNAVSKPAMKP